MRHMPGFPRELTVILASAALLLAFLGLTGSL